MTTTWSLGVAIPSFNQGEFVAEAIASLRALPVPFAAVVQDGGSDRATLYAIETAIDGDDRFTLVVEPDDGQSDAINRAWRRLVDEHACVTWLNTDDVVVADGVSAAMSLLQADDQVAVAYGDLTAIDQHGKVVGRTRSPDRVGRFRLVNHHNLVPGILPIIRSGALREVGLLDTGLSYAMDHDLFIRLAGIGELRRIPATIAHYRVHDDAKTWAHKEAMEGEVAAVRTRHRTLPGPIAEVVRLALRMAWIPTRRRYTSGVMRRSNRQIRSR